MRRHRILRHQERTRYISGWEPFRRMLYEQPKSLKTGRLSERCKSENSFFLFHISILLEIWNMSTRVFRDPSRFPWPVKGQRAAQRCKETPWAVLTNFEPTYQFKSTESLAELIEISKRMPNKDRYPRAASKAVQSFQTSCLGTHLSVFTRLAFDTCSSAHADTSLLRSAGLSTTFWPASGERTIAPFLMVSSLFESSNRL